MRVVIAGSRSNTSYEKLDLAIKNSNIDVDKVLTGGGRGVDMCAIIWSLKNGIDCTIYPPKMNQYPWGKGGIKRIEEMCKSGQALIALWDGKCDTTQSVIETMISKKRKCYIELNGKVLKNPKKYLRLRKEKNA